MDDRACEVAPPDAARDWLPGADFADAFQINTRLALNALEATERCVSNPAFWIRALIETRDFLVRPLGLKTGAVAGAAVETVGYFPVVHRSDEKVVLGLDDRHLDFRIVIDAEPAEPGTIVTATTLVKSHGWFGRTYLSSIKPFHRLIVRRMLERIE